MVTKVSFNLMFLIAICVLNNSCNSKIVPSEIRNNFKNCYDGKNTNLKEKLNTNGYFVIAKSFDKYMQGNSTKHEIMIDYDYLMFYDDGIFVFDFFDLNNKRKSADSCNINLFFKEITTEKDSVHLLNFQSYFNWGKYILSGDTIKTEYVNHPGGANTWSAWEVWYKILDINTIIEIYSNPIHYTTKNDWDNYQKAKKNKKNVPAKFVSVPIKPSSNCWLKKEKWFWCNEEDWKKYMLESKNSK